MVVDQPWSPAHPGGAIGAFTLPGGNPDLSTVRTGQSDFGAVWVDHAGATCSRSVRLNCSSKGHGFAIDYEPGGLLTGIYMA
ncbi:hypothetical protein [Nocardia sp. IFM 10818]